MQSIREKEWFSKARVIVALTEFDGVMQVHSTDKPRAKSALMDFLGFSRDDIGMPLDIYHPKTRRGEGFLLLHRPRQSQGDSFRSKKHAQARCEEEGGAGLRSTRKPETLDEIERHMKVRFSLPVSYHPALPGLQPSTAM